MILKPAHWSHSRAVECKAKGSVPHLKAIDTVARRRRPRDSMAASGAGSSSSKRTVTVCFAGGMYDHIERSDSCDQEVILGPAASSLGVLRLL